MDHMQIGNARRIVVAFAIFWFARSIFAQDVPAPADDGFHFAVAATYMYGPVDGYVQVPAGGTAGTTSSKRPKFSEIGIDNASLYTSPSPVRVRATPSLSASSCWRSSQIQRASRSY
jgi:hypothetical protein